MSNKNCKVIATYFGPRRNHAGTNESALDFSDTIDMLDDAVKIECEVSSGVKKDTIIVNHDFGNKEGKKFLNKLDGTKTKDGVIKILHRPFNKGVGGSFASFNYAFEQFRNDYEYWFFNEDDTYVVAEGYMKQIIKQLSADHEVAYVCVGYHQTVQSGYIIRTGGYPAHAHGGCGGTHIKFLNECYDKLGKLPHSELIMNDDMITSIKDGTLTAFDSGYARDWYRKFELDGEVRFSNVYQFELGYKLQDIEMGKPVVYSVRLQEYY